MCVMEIGSNAVRLPKARILLVSSDPIVAAKVVQCLTDNNMVASTVSRRAALFRSLSVREPDVVIIDLPLEGDDGLELLRELRRRSYVPVVLLTRHDDSSIDYSLALDAGADDLLVKPFNHRVLPARLRASLRRRTLDAMYPPKRDEQSVRFDGWLFDPRARELTNPMGVEVGLTKGEFALLSAFVKAPGRALSREHLLQATRVHEDVFDRSIDVQILRLRRKLEPDPARPSVIRTVRGKGYVFDAAVDAVRP